ncbi:hypothetical protein IODZLFCR_CDS0064 [Salmonella phage vB_SalP_SE29]|uniref:Uncharacterized protein n=1 Tax=Salmonella phage vB_SalP_SE29 TaxID=3134913 RepID=A0AAX4LXI1_9CAUD
MYSLSSTKGQGRAVLVRWNAQEALGQALV